MKRCPITYEVIPDDECYSRRGLRLLSAQLKDLEPLQLTAYEQRIEAAARAGKMSVQGVQTKLSAKLKIQKKHFELVDNNGHFILKTQSEYYPELPENEAITMSLAESIGLEVPLHGLVYSKDMSMTYFIRRFDRVAYSKKLAVEDFTQLSGLGRYTKYNSSMEQVIAIICKFCTFPKIELSKLFKLTVFNYLVGNEDMHLKNFSLITRDNKIILSPAYDLLNTTIAQANPKEEIALPLKGKKNNLKKRDLLYYFPIERSGLNNNVVTAIIQDIQSALPTWREMISISFLSEKMREKYLNLLNERVRQLEL